MMPNANILNLEGKRSGSVELPAAFGEEVRRDLIARAIHAENTTRLQPQAHYLLAGMQTTARYYGAMSSYRTGRHMGMAIRPRQKLGGGVQGKVKRIPSAVKGKRAHPHKIEKVLIERINSKEYQKAIRSAIAATIDPKYARVKLEGIQMPLILSSDIENIRKTKDMVALLSRLGLTPAIEIGKKKTKKKGIRRAHIQRKYRKSILMVLGGNSNAVKAARNISGAEVCAVEDLSANKLAPGGLPGRLTIWSEAAISKLDAAINSMKL